MSLLNDKKAKAKEITLGGAIILIIVGILFLSASGTDPTGVIFWIGIVFLLVGVISLIAVILSFFK